MKDQIELPALPDYAVRQEWGFSNEHMFAYARAALAQGKS